ncbi:SDR family NAD(P)-dependent oxidoreductase, partial [Myxococcus sp. AM001]|nr:SDR family NAD(P)-dependent oxidoreductase [Myxococcus sp. AM001]
MSDATHENELKQRMARAVLAMQKVQAKLDTLEKARTEPIAIVGMGCRFPGGADSPEAYWKLLEEGRDAVRREPASRRQGPESGAPRWGGYLEEVDGFDADFFGISPREAASLDPQQRLLLEVSWEALEDAGQNPEKLLGSSTGVFVGITGNDYERVLPMGADQLDAYYITGNGHCFPPGRVSYVLGLQGPSLAVDTACSSSLVAVHLACQSLRLGECNLALAGGVNLILDSLSTEMIERTQSLSPNGRCSTFDAWANGFVRGEGCGVIVLKRLSDAQAQGDTILAVVRGSAINQDGRSTGLTAPNVLAQQALLRQALANARVEPSAIGYIEAHGTGTSLGDPIEVEALADVVGAPRADGSRCALASVKTNLGHLESAAGIAGLMKVVLSMRHERIPRHLNFTRLNPRIRMEGTAFVIPAEGALPWARSEKRRLAGVSSFGMSGTNAHIVLEEAPARAVPSVAPSRPASHLLLLTAKSEDALVEQARQYASHLSAHPELDAADVCFTANTTRARFNHRSVVVGESTQALAEALRGFARGELSDAVASGEAAPRAPRVAFLFTGQGSQYAGMGRELYAASPVFRDALDQCARLLRPRMELLPVLFPAEGAHSPIDQTEYSQPALFALEYALAQVWKGWGVVPHAVMGHSVGEFAAAVVAGHLSLEDGLALITERGRLMQALPPGGAMLSVFATEAQVRPLLEPHLDQVSLACLNAPGQVVLSGAGAVLARLDAELQAQGVRTKALVVSHAFHSPLMEPMLDALEAQAARVTPLSGAIPLVSNVTGRPVGTGELGAPGYWRRHAREPVRFQQGTESLRELGIDVFVEVGPTATLLGLGRACLGEQAAWIASLRKGRPDAEQVLGALGRLFLQGHDVDWRAVDPEPSRGKVALPTYPWRRQRYWPVVSARLPVERSESAPAHDGAVAATTLDAASLLQVRWEASTASGPDEGAPGAWMLLCDQGGVGEALAARLEQRGVPHVKVYAGASSVPGALAVDPADGVALAKLWRERFPQSLPRAGVVHLWGLDVPGVESPGALRSSARERCISVVSALRALESSEALSGRLWVVTREACAVEAGGAPVEPSQALLWGLGRVAALEHPERWGGLVDLESAGGDAQVAALEEVLTRGAGEGEEQLALRGGRRFVPRLAQCPLPPARTATLEAAATYLITGGQGELGLHVARWMVSQGARHLVLTARSAFPERAEWEALAARGGDVAARILAVQALEAAGATVVLARADVSRHEQLAELLEQVRTTMPPLKGVVHAAGVSTHARLRELDASALDAVLAPKVEGAWHLHALTREVSLDFFVLFSSISAVWGSVGSGHYAAGNAFLDALAQHRRALGLPATSINWGPWAGRGMASPDAQRWLANMGVDSLEVGEGVAWFERLLGADLTQATVARVRWERFKPIYEARGRRPFLEAMGAEAAAPTVAPAASPAPVLGRDALESAVRQQVAGVLGLDPKRPIPSGRGFADLGMDSLMAVELRERLQRVVGQPLSATLVFNYPNVQALTEYLVGLVAERTPRTEAPEAKRVAHADEPIAIIGMACRFPGDADSPEAYWRLLRDGVDATTEVPADRWDVDALFDVDPEAPGKVYMRKGGFLRDVAGFEPQFFGISPREAESMDPQQRLLLEVGWEALERSGINPDTLRDTNTGVFVGITASDYSRVILNQDPSAVDAYFASGTSLNVAPGRLSFALGLHGPSMAVDTACSSSLVALHLACQSLRSGESTLALSGGVNLILTPEATLSICKAHMLSPEGRCKTFDASADGFARGEGCGVLVLKRLSEAVADGNEVLAVIRGTAVNHDGPSSGLTVPNGMAQQAVIRQALENGGVRAGEVSYVEAHGTGTSLGDPIEVDA